MSIVPLAKVTMYGAASQKDAVLDGLQSLGCVHLVDLEAVERPVEATEYISTEAREALAYLQSCPMQRRPVRAPERFDFEQVQAQALEIQRRERELNDERDQLRRSAAELGPWGDFRLPSGGELGELRFWFFITPHYRLKAFGQTDHIWHLVGRDRQFAYVVVLSEAEPEGIFGTRADLDERPLSEIKERLEGVENQLEELYWQRLKLTRWRSMFAQALDEADDRAAREDAAKRTLDDGPIFAFAGWVPQESLPDVRRFAEEHTLALIEQEPAAEDRPPTLLRNPRPLAGGEDAVTFYTTPAYGSWDPSPVVFTSFAVFFGMIVADAGYGLVLGVLLLLLWRRVGRARIASRLRFLTLALVAASVSYGVLLGSYFGVRPGESSLLGSVRVLDAQDQSVMMPLSIGIGVIHLTVAQLVTAWRERRSLRALASLGWTAILAGGYALVLGWMGSVQPETLARLGTPMMAVGAAAVLLFSSKRGFSTKLRHVAGRLLDGTRALFGVSQAFGDVLSYLRLFALGLAGTQLAITFNDLAGRPGTTAVGHFLGLLILLVGHGLNFTLVILSGVVHGLRLNCIEFFNWSLPEEGHPFRAFRKKAGH
jgi:V/A-type H+/Na+-transporting ATPase subunit I